MQFYVVGGKQKPGVDDSIREWHHYAAGVVALVDTDTGEVKPVAEYVSPTEVCASDADPSIVFKTATLIDDRMYVPTQTEILVYEVPSFKQVGYVSHPCFNDLHHARPNGDGKLLVANTGLDMVVELTTDGVVTREWNTLRQDPWERFSRDVDYRKVLTTKPHQSHPNHVWELDGEIWATRCNQKDAFCLTRELPPIPISEKLIHDGLLHGDSIYFTAVSGEVIVVDAETRAARGRYDLNAIAGSSTPLGWCRGIEVIDADHVVVGFSRLRPTRWKENVQWVKHKLGGDGHGLRPTRLAMFDLRNEKMCWELDVEPAGLNVIFSVHTTQSK